jgi:hypothetical protein
MADLLNYSATLLVKLVFIIILWLIMRIFLIYFLNVFKMLNSLNYLGTVILLKNEIKFHCNFEESVFFIMTMKAEDVRFYK